MVRMRSDPGQFRGGRKHAAEPENSLEYRMKVSARWRVSTLRARHPRPLTQVTLAQPVAVVILAANAAVDMEGRISAHAIFSVVRTGPELPFRFPAPIYGITQIFGLKAGQYSVALRGGEGLNLESKPITLRVSGSGFGIAVIPIGRCSVEKLGTLTIGVVINDEAVAGSATLIAIGPKQDEEGG